MVIQVKKAGSVFYIRFEDGSKAYLATTEEGDTLKLVETYTPEHKRGRGYGRILVEEAIRYAREKDLKIVPICSYSIYYFLKNPDKRDILADEFRKMSDEELMKLYEERRAQGH